MVVAVVEGGGCTPRRAVVPLSRVEDVLAVWWYLQPAIPCAGGLYLYDSLKNEEEPPKAWRTWKGRCALLETSRCGYVDERRCFIGHRGRLAGARATGERILKFERRCLVGQRGRSAGCRPWAVALPAEPREATMTV